MLLQRYSQKERCGFVKFVLNKFVFLKTKSEPVCHQSVSDLRVHTIISELQLSTKVLFFIPAEQECTASHKISSGANMAASCSISGSSSGILKAVACHVSLAWVLFVMQCLYVLYFIKAEKRKILLYTKFLYK